MRQGPELVFAVLFKVARFSQDQFFDYRLARPRQRECRYAALVLLARHCPGLTSLGTAELVGYSHGRIVAVAEAAFEAPRNASDQRVVGLVKAAEAILSTPKRLQQIVPIDLARVEMKKPARATRQAPWDAIVRSRGAPSGWLLTEKQVARLYGDRVYGAPREERPGGGA